MVTKNILFFNPADDHALQKTVHRALRAAGGNVILCKSVPEVESHIKDQSISLVLLNYDSGTSDAMELTQKLLTQYAATPTVLLSQQKDKAHLIQLFSNDRIRNLIARNEEVSEEELIITTEKLLRQDIFGLEKYLTWGVQLIEEPLVDSSQKDTHVGHVGDYVRSLNCDRRFVQLAEVVADELLMNAFYDAPVDSSGKSKYAHLPRSERVRLGKGEEGKLIYGSDGRYFAISCSDQFGALNAKTVVSYLRKCFVQDDRQIDNKSGGAGVGFFMIFQSLSQLVVNIEPGVRTETMGLLDIRKSYKDAKSRTKSFNIFIKEGKNS